MTILECKIIKELKKRNETKYINNITRLCNNISPLLERVVVVFSNYTIHDINHSIRVADFMYDLLPNNIEYYSSTELTIMIFSAMLHDIGMVVSSTGNDIKFIEQNDIRKKHHILSANYISEKLQSDYFDFKDNSNINFRTNVAKIVQSHGESIDWIVKNINGQEIFGNEEVNSQFVAYLLWLGDLVDFDSRRTPKILFDFIDLNAISKLEWNKQIAITSYNKIGVVEQIGTIKKYYIYFEGNCTDPETYRSILDYFEYINSIIKLINFNSKNANNKYRITIEEKVHNKIKIDNVNTIDLQYQMDYLKIANLLMGKNLYGNCKYALRELLQNSIDACNLMQEIANKNEIDYSPKIKIKYEKDNISIIDNGIGMSKDHIKKYFLNIGNSYYDSEEYKNNGYKQIPISHYGIGFLSSFLLSDDVIVKTFDWQNENKGNELILKKTSRFVLEKEIKGSSLKHGTEIILNRNTFEEYFKTQGEVENFIKETFKICNIKLIFINETNSKELAITDTNKTGYADLSKYLNEIECTCKINFSKYSLTLRNNNEIIDDDEYLYLPEQLPDSIFILEDLLPYCEENNINLNITDIINQNSEVQILEMLPITEDCFNEYLTAKEYLEDTDTTFEYIDSKNSFESLRIILDANNYYDFESYDVAEFGINNYWEETAILEEQIKPFFKALGFNDNFYIPILSTKKIFYNNNYYTFLGNELRLTNYDKIKLYLKNICIPNFSIEIPILISDFNVSNLEINILQKNCFPDVSRSKLSSLNETKLGYAIGRAIHLYIIDNILLSENKKQLIKDFIDTYYGDIESNKFCKK